MHANQKSIVHGHFPVIIFVKNVLMSYRRIEKKKKKKHLKIMGERGHRD